LILAKPEVFIYFITFILVVSIALMNLVTALMVESSFAQASEGKQRKQAVECAKKKKLIVELGRIFKTLDLDHSGMIDLCELQNAPQDAQERLHTIAGSNDSGQLIEIFNTLDFDNRGQVGIKEFCEGLLKVQDGKPLEIFSIMNQCYTIMEISKGTLRLLEQLRHEMHNRGSAGQT